MVRRVTTNGTMYGYKNTLQRTYQGLNKASNRVINNRRFNSYAEDPAAASRAFQMRRARWNTESQMASNDSVTGKFSQGWDALEKVYNDLGNELGNFSTLRGASDATASGRKSLGQSLMATAESLVFTMNSKYADTYIFSGADGMNAPFAWDEDGDLTFRGVKVDMDPSDPAYQGRKAVYSVDISDLTVTAGDSFQFGDAGVSFNLFSDGNGVVDVDAAMEALVNAYNNDGDVESREYVASYEDGVFTLTAKEVGEKTAPTAIAGGDTLEVTTVAEGVDKDEEAIKAAEETQKIIQSMLQETTFVDLGMGMEEDAAGKIKPDTAFNSALCGLKYLGGSDDQMAKGLVYGGYGLDEDGDPYNFISLMKKAGELLYNCDQDSGAWGEMDSEGKALDETTRAIDRLMDKLHTSLGKVSLTHVELDTDVAFLNANKDRLKALDDTLNEQIVGIEDVDPAEAITELMWAQYSYNAALRIGNGILSQSLLDYLS